MAQKLRDLYFPGVPTQSALYPDLTSVLGQDTPGITYQKINSTLGIYVGGDALLLGREAKTICNPVVSQRWAHRTFWLAYKTYPARPFLILSLRQRILWFTTFRLFVFGYGYLRFTTFIPRCIICSHHHDFALQSPMYYISSYISSSCRISWSETCGSNKPLRSFLRPSKIQFGELTACISSCPFILLFTSLTACMKFVKKLPELHDRYGL